MVDDLRLLALADWLTTQSGCSELSLRPASSDASFRRYFRYHTDSGNSSIVMDAPPEQEPCDQFVAIARQLHRAGLHAPEVIETNLSEGFLILEDLGSTCYLDRLDEHHADPLYDDAIAAISIMQTLSAEHLPRFDDAMIRAELGLFRDWYLVRHLRLDVTEVEHLLETLAAELVDNALQQPQVWVHRDYHSRNLMVCERNNPGIIDFQDAVLGPLTYDLVSLLKDCYIAWPQERITEWVTRFYQLTSQQRSLPELDQFLRWFDLMGVQRHMKAIGIFSRLNYRDHKPGYLADIPRCIDYLAQQADGLPALQQLLEWIYGQDIHR